MIDSQRPQNFGGRITHTDVKMRLKKNMREVFNNEPSTVKRANVSDERKRKMKTAIAFSKTRKNK